MLIDCDTCLMRETHACDDCVVTFLLEDGPLELDGPEQDALGVLADAGLVPHLRLVSSDEPGPPHAASA